MSNIRFILFDLMIIIISSDAVVVSLTQQSVVFVDVDLLSSSPSAVRMCPPSTIVPCGSHTLLLGLTSSLVLVSTSGSVLQILVYEGEMERAQGQLEAEMQNLEEEKNRVIEEAFIRAESEMKAVHENLAGQTTVFFFWTFQYIPVCVVSLCVWF